MRPRSIAAAVVVAASWVGFAQSIVGAEEPAPVVITAHPCSFVLPPETGIWAASGAINDAGSYVSTFAASAPPDRPPFTLGPFREAFLFTGARGTFVVKAEERLTASGQVGVWQIDSGTGAYASTSGHGEVAFSATPAPSCFGGITFTLTLTGVASKVA